MYDELNLARQGERGTRRGSRLNTHPQTRYRYVLRGLVVCSCGRRMAGTKRRSTTYYQCWPKPNNLGRPDTYEHHPTTVYVREDVLLYAVTEFYADRVFGPERTVLLAADLAKGLRATYNQLDDQHRTTGTELDALDAAADTGGATNGPDARLLLEALPQLSLTLHDAPDALQRTLYDVTQLAIQIDHGQKEITMKIKIPEDRIDAVAGVATRVPAGATSQGVSVQLPRREDYVRTPRGAAFERAIRGRLGQIDQKNTESDGDLIDRGLVDVDRRQTRGVRKMVRLITTKTDHQAS
ncbi:zinc ribbon domain-containing protein [Frankia sp. AiPs1]|uniref:zinc ribbon domain-containing protein n=1 Tax=Frankia sp. AiPs1 TaxID=573493 RepID=UPI0020434306|nr:zinc ribbon domain-containing protein [Frankia sp. AiPs1]MCM3920612.1 zinc ribbon domain-containing protein [Frankia sp. AiPs1]